MTQVCDRLKGYLRPAANKGARALHDQSQTKVRYWKRLNSGSTTDMGAFGFRADGSFPAPRREARRGQTSVFSESASASSTSTPRLRTVLSILV